jgi:hypothetical protein
MFRPYTTSLLAAILFASTGGMLGEANSQPADDLDDYLTSIQPIFDRRCVACHSCYNAPCQLNLQNYSGFMRGATKLNVYDGARLKSVAPTRLDIDAHSIADWRAKDFFDVVGGPDPARSLLMRLISLRVQQPNLQPKRTAGDSNFCPVDNESALLATQYAAELGMPYGLPPLSNSETAALNKWIAGGVRGPSDASLARQRAAAAAEQSQVRAWQAFLNGKTPREKLLARYLYEHLFLAHLHFASETASERPAFFRLVRSRTPCEEDIDEIATRRPNDDPGIEGFQYCLNRLEGTIVDKTHIPYELSPRKLERIRQIFLAPEWDVNALPGYSDDTAANPFVTFADIPVRARYQFLLDDADYEVNSFIKGPVCNGSIAVSSIQEQFFVLFLSPDADNMVMSTEHARAAQNLLILPGMWGSDVALRDDVPFFRRLVEQREGYRKLRADSARRLRPAGCTLQDIWNGDGNNPSALLTVFRHFDNAAVTRGAAGDLSKTLFVLDYPLFERLVYNLVVNYDVFGNIGHQSLTRLYMDMIRMEAEELLLDFLPASQRPKLRNSWYRGGPLSDLKLRFIFPLLDSEAPTGIAYRNADNAKAEFVERVLNERLAAPVRGRPDTLNWKTLRLPQEAETGMAAPERALRRIASIKAVAATPFARFFPELAILLLRGEDGRARLYSIVHNREHTDISWILGESDHLAPEEDSLTVRAGVLGAYPNMFFVVREAEIEAFSDAVARLRSTADYELLVDRFGARRTNEDFWSIFDAVNAAHLADDPVRSGILDLTRYALEQN